MLEPMSKENRRRDEGGDLGAAALALDQELRRFEEMAAAVGRAPLNTQKGLEQAARATRDAAASQGRFAEHLKTLVEAVSAARERQANAAAAINARVTEIDARATLFAALRERFAQLGLRAGEVAVEQALSGLGVVVEDAQKLAQDAREADAQDVARETDTLRQQVLSARNKLGLLLKHLEGEGSS
jgi:hypothetical protein